MSGEIGGAITGSIVSGLFLLLAPYIDRRRAARYLAIRVSICLDEYVGICASAMFEPDPHEIPPDSDPMDHFKTPPVLNLPDDVDWRSIRPQLAYDILSLVNETVQATESVSYLWGVASGDAAFEEMCDCFSAIGLRANELSVLLRKSSKLKQSSGVKPPSSGYSPLSKLKERHAQREEKHKKAAVPDIEKLAGAA